MHDGMSRVIKILRPLEGRKMKLIGEGGGGWRGLDLFDDRYKGTYIKQKNRCFINNCTTIEFLISDNFPSLFLYMKKSS